MSNLPLEKLTQELQDKLKLIEEQNAKLENTQTAVLNVLEDLELSKNNLTKEKAKDEAILESIGEGMIATDKEGKIILINNQATAMLGFQINDLLNKNLIEVLQIKDEKENNFFQEEQPFRLALSSGKKVSIACYFISKGQRNLPVALTVSPIRQNTSIEGIILVFRDISKEKEVDRMKTEFISLASHQLRTPLAAIRWSGEVLLDGNVGELNLEQKEVVQNMYLSVRRMIDLVNSLLNISRIESGHLAITPEPTDLNNLVQDVIKEIKIRVEEKKQRLTINVEPNIPTINIDPKLLRQVYINLLNNAIKYTPNSGEIMVNIGIKGNEIISQIKDTGYGIPKEECSKIFQKFYRGTNIVKIETDGSGLGLYLIKTIIEALKGRIWFESEENRGTSFWFSLPTTEVVEIKGEKILDT